MADSSDRRTFARWLIGEPGTLRVAGRATACTVVNVSPGGMLLRMAAGPGMAADRGAEVVVMLAGLPPFRARVTRAAAGGEDLAVAFVDGPQYIFR